MALGTLNRLTVRQLAAATSTIGDGGGLYFNPTGGGRGNWTFKFMSPLTGKRREMGFGSFPQITLAEARRKAQEARLAVQDGMDPLEAAALPARGGVAPSFITLAGAMIDTRRASWRNAKHASQWRSTLDAYARPRHDAARDHRRGSVRRGDTDHETDTGLEPPLRAARRRQPELDLEHAPALGAPIQTARLEVLAPPADADLAAKLGVTVDQPITPLCIAATTASVFDLARSFIDARDMYRFTALALIPIRSAVSCAVSPAPAARSTSISRGLRFGFIVPP